MPNSSIAVSFVDTSHALRRHGICAAGREQPVAHGLRVHERLERREALRADHEQRRRGVHALQHVRERHAVDVRHEVHTEPLLHVFGQRSHRHDDAEVRATDADVHDVRDRLAREAQQLARVQRFSERAHLAALGFDERHHVLAVSRERPIGRAAQRDVQRGPVLGVVDRVTGEHQLDPARHFGLLGELDERRSTAGSSSLPAEVEQADPSASSDRRSKRRESAGE